MVRRRPGGSVASAFDRSFHSTDQERAPGRGRQGFVTVSSLDASFYEVIRRNEDGTPGAVVVPGSPLAAIFAPLIAQLNAKANYPAATGIKKCPASLAGAAYHPPGYGPMPFENAACIEEAYNSDVYYDPQTARIGFWRICGRASGNVPTAGRVSTSSAILKTSAILFQPTC